MKSMNLAPGGRVEKKPRGARWITTGLSPIHLVCNWRFEVISTDINYLHILNIHILWTWQLDYITHRLGRSISSQPRPPFGRWEELPLMLQGRERPAAVTLGGSLYVCGGLEKAVTPRLRPVFSPWWRIFPWVDDSYGWWSGRFLIFPYIGNNHPNWLIFFGGVETTNQVMYYPLFPFMYWGFSESTGILSLIN